MYILGMAHLDMKQRSKAENLLAETKELRKTIIGKEWGGPSKGEESFDKLVNFWSR
jgi:hypothetical protein